jgi:magnesium transporter
MYRRFRISADGIRETTEGEAQLLAYSAPDSRERADILETLRIDSYDLDSALDSDEVPRLEFTEHQAFMIWKTPKPAQVRDSIQLSVSSIGLVLMPTQLAFIMSEGEIEFVDREFRNVLFPTDVLLSTLLRTVRQYVGHLRVIRQISGELEKKITVSMENRYLIQMFALSESLVYYTDAIEGNGAVLDKLRNARSRVHLSDSQLQLLDDIILENRQASRQANIYSSVLSGLMDARGTIVNNNMNVLLKNLTLINIVFLPLNLIASIGGMSEWSMMTDNLDWRISFGLFSIGMVLFGWLTWIAMTLLIAKSERRVPSGKKKSHRVNVD